MTSLIGITGGIGAGKSVVSRILLAMGFQVYDTDREARRIMDTDPHIQRQINEKIHPRAVVDGVVDRPIISSVVFADPAALERLNTIVHQAVIDDVERWRSGLTASRAFVESAILFQCPLHEHIDAAWIVEAPDDLRIARVQQRSGLTADQVTARIAAQSADIPTDIPTHTITNDNTTPILPQIHHLLTQK